MAVDCVRFMLPILLSGSLGTYRAPSAMSHHEAHLTLGADLPKRLSPHIPSSRALATSHALDSWSPLKLRLQGDTGTPSKIATQSLSSRDTLAPNRELKQNIGWRRVRYPYALHKLLVLTRQLSCENDYPRNYEGAEYTDRS